uniref:Neurotransmitter-gated ion-channel ligand-binding domain-containing protein n=1 Tax=Anopheles melas TaxID=34690 RepID=A0A182TTF4_9DIPT
MKQRPTNQTRPADRVPFRDHFRLMALLQTMETHGALPQRFGCVRSTLLQPRFGHVSNRLCMAGYNEKRLLHDLLDSYNILERPVVNESDPLQLSFGLTLMQIIDVVSSLT